MAFSKAFTDGRVHVSQKTGKRCALVRRQLLALAQGPQAALFGDPRSKVAPRQSARGIVMNRLCEQSRMSLSGEEAVGFQEGFELQPSSAFLSNQ